MPKGSKIIIQPQIGHRNSERLKQADPESSTDKN